MQLPIESLNNGSVSVGGVQHTLETVLVHCDAFSLATWYLDFITRRPFGDFVSLHLL